MTQNSDFSIPKKKHGFFKYLFTNIGRERSRALRKRETGPRIRFEQLEGTGFSITCRT